MKNAEAIKNRAIAVVERASHLPACAKRTGLLRFAIVGGGPTGVELASELADLFFGTFEGLYGALDMKKHVEITLVQAEKELMPHFAPKIREQGLTTLKRMGVKVLLDASVAEVRQDGLVFANGKTVPASTVIWTAGIAPQPIAVSDSKLKNEHGRFAVNEYLQSTSNERIFALGDIAEITDAKDGQVVPQTAQAAVAQAEIVAGNIARAMLGKKLKRFRYRKKGDLVSLGRWRAAGTMFGISFSGRFAWWLWRTVYLFKLLSWQKKIKVAVDWTLHLSSKRDISEL